MATARENDQRHWATPGPGGASAHPSPTTAVAELMRACHPVPSIGVTGMAGALAALAGNDLGRTLLVMLTVFVGQLSIGWSNDAIDADRDRRSARTDKPVAAGRIAPAVVSRAAAIAVILAVFGSALLGPWAGGAALVIVAAGWLYNAGVKSTLWSWLPYAVAFGALPAVATLARADHPFPAAWAMLAGALLGVAAHLANVAPDLGADLATGVRGLPHRLGRRGTSLLGPVLLAVAAVTIFSGAGSKHNGWRIADLFVSLTAAALAARIAGQDGQADGGRRYFLATMVAAVLDIALFAASGHRLS